MSDEQQSRIKDLIAKGKEQGYLTYAEVNDHLPEDISDPDQVEDIIQMINDMGIKVFEQAPDADEMLLADDDSTDDIAAAEAAAALAAVETEAGRTTDPVRMYMREMGTVELLTREGEIAIAKRIEEGVREKLAALAFFPNSVESILDVYAEVEAGDKKLGDFLLGYLDPNDVVPTAQEIAEAQAAKTAAAEKGETVESDDNADTGPDPELAQERFDALREQLSKTDKAIKRYGRDAASTKKNLTELGELFKYFKIAPRILDPIMEKPRQALQSIRTQEREILRMCVQVSKMPRKVFLKNFIGNEKDSAWMHKLIEDGSEIFTRRLAGQMEDIERAQRKMASIEAECDLEIPEIKEINRRISLGEARARRAKKEMVEANLRLVIFYREKIYQPWPAISRSYPGRQYWFDEGSRQV